MSAEQTTPDVRAPITSALVLEDETAIRNLERTMLNMLKIPNVYEAACVEDAIMLFDQHNPGLVVTDNSVIGAQNGEVLVRYVNQHSPSTPVIWCSSEKPPSDLELAAVLIKPVGYTAFANAVAAARNYQPPNP